MQTTIDNILKHHGGDGQIARERITESYERRHDEAFWQFWEKQIATSHQAGDTIIDLGSGIGQFIANCAQRYPSAQVIGIEIAPYMLAEPRPLPTNARVINTDLNEPDTQRIPFASASMIMANMVVHELTQPIKMFKAAHTWLKTGGRMCIIDVVRQPLKDYLNRRYPDTQMYQAQTTRADLEDAFEHFLEHNRYHPADIEFMLTSAGFKHISTTTLRQGNMTQIIVEKI